MSKKITVTLTDRPPVTFIAHNWPVLTASAHENYLGGTEVSWTRKVVASLRVRQHGDGRCIVYGWYHYHSAWQGEESFRLHAGELLDSGSGMETIVSSIRGVGQYLREKSDDASWANLVDACIASLPAEEI